MSPCLSAWQVALLCLAYAVVATYAYRTGRRVGYMHGRHSINRRTER